MKLSIIIPYYNTPEYTDELLKCLDRQMVKDVEVFLIDDGSEPYEPKYAWLNVIHVKHGGQGRARNIGLNKASGEYVTFIDSDDLVADWYIEKIIHQIDYKTSTIGPDIIEFSWKSIGNGQHFDVKLKPGDRQNFPSVCIRAFRRSYIGDTRFSEIKDATEDEDFSRRLGYAYEPLTYTTITDYMYYYRTDVVGSNVKSYKKGERDTKRVLYYYDHVDPNPDLLESIKADDVRNEVILMTNRCNMPELKRYCQILRPCKLWTHYLKGEPCGFAEVIPFPIKAEIMLYIRNLHVIGGIESFIYYFGSMFADRDVLLVAENIPLEQQRRLERHLKIVKYSPSNTYSCDLLIRLRILDECPQNIEYGKAIQMVHGCKTNPKWSVPPDADEIVCVSEACKSSFGYETTDAKVIHNPITYQDKKALVLVSATRIPAPDKGNNEIRMRKLAEMLNKADIPFLWFNFSEGVIPNPPDGMVNMCKKMDIRPYILKADYLVQLSDSEAWSYSILEALTSNVPVIVCPFESAYEMNIEDGKNGYIVPFDMNFDVHRLLNIPKFKYQYDNDAIKAEWEKVLKKKRGRKKSGVNVTILKDYYDLQLKRNVESGEVIRVSLPRAGQLIINGYARG